MKCPDNTYSPPGTIGLNECIKRKPCTEYDYTFSFTSCADNKRAREFYWKLPKICDENAPDSI